VKAHDFKKVIKKLKLEFDLQQDNTDHESYDIYKNGKYITMIKNSFSTYDYQDQLIARNLHISRTQLRNYKECTFSNEQLKTTMKAKSIWPEDL